MEGLPQLCFQLGYFQQCMDCAPVLGTENLRGGLQGLGPSPTIDGATIFIIFAKFFYLFILSLILGTAFGLGGAWMLKKCDASSTPQVRIAAV